MSQMLVCASSSLLRFSKTFSTVGTHLISRNSSFLQEASAVKSATFQTLKKVYKFSFQWPNRNPVSQITKRHYAKKQGNLSFEVEANVTKDVTVFTYSNKQFFRMLSIFGIVQFFFWANMAMFAYSGLNGLETKSKEVYEGQGSWWNMVIDFENQHKYRITVACIALGYMILFFTWIYPLRTISKLILEKGGQMVRISTYTHFGRTKDFVVPLKDISCTQSRLGKGVQVAVKIRGRWFYYLMDKREGKFVDPHLFDYVVGLNRSLK